MDHAARFTTAPQHVEDARAGHRGSMATVERVHSDGAPSAARHVDEDLTQQAILAILLSAHPAHRSIDEVVREVAGSTTAFAERDRVNDGIRDLVGAGSYIATAGSSSPRAPPCDSMSSESDHEAVATVTVGSHDTRSTARASSTSDKPIRGDAPDRRPGGVAFARCN